ncbi:hypothetical protein OY671_011300, partial [Metschnikowia pulcherrima]
MSWRESLRFWAPHGSIELWDHAREQREQRIRRERFQPARRQFDFNYPDCSEFLASLGCDPHHAREGSIPEKSLHFALGFSPDRPTSRVSHVGNYSGLSSAALADELRRRGPDHSVIGVDPNSPHRGTDRPQDSVARVLSRYG